MPQTCGRLPHPALRSLALLLFVFSFPTAFAAGPNLVPNPGFEKTPAGKRSPASWGIGYKRFDGSWETAQESRPGSTGKVCLQINTRPEHSRIGFTSPLIPIDPAKTYEQGAWLRTAGPDVAGTGVRIGRWWYGKDRKPLPGGQRGAFTFMAGNFKPAAWTKVSETLVPDLSPDDGRYKENEIPAKAAYVSYWILVWKYDGKAWVDDVWLREVDAEGDPLAAMAPGLEDQHRVASDLDTPHTKWARPYARGRTMVLMLCGAGAHIDTYSRELTELAQRFDIDARVVYWHDGKGYAGWEAGRARLIRLIKDGFDCCILLKVPLKELDSEVQFRLLEQVVAGKGVVMLGKPDPRVLKEENLIGALPDFLASVPCKAYAVGKGRGLLLPEPPVIRYDLGWEVAFDHWQERFGRAVLCAAGREPSSRLQVTVASRNVARSALPARQCVMRWSGAPEACALRLRLRREDGDVVFESEGAGVKGEGSFPFVVPRLRGGKYHMDAWLRTDKGVENWATQEFSVTTKRRVAGVKLASDWAEVGGSIRATVSLSGPEGEADRLRVRLLDADGRILVQGQQAAKGDAIPFDFLVLPWLPTLVRVEAVLMDDEAEVSSAHAYFTVTTRRGGPFSFVMWDYPRGTLAPYGLRSLADCGVTTVLSRMNPSRESAAYGMDWIPYATRIIARLDADGVMKPLIDAKQKTGMCWNDEKAIGPYVDGIARKYQSARQQGVLAYGLGDEVHVKGACLHPACLRAYREYLRDRYRIVDKLNESWGTGYKDFADVQLLDPKDSTESAALKSGNTARWYDRLAFAYANQVRLCERFRDAFRKYDPQAIVGYEGAGRFRDKTDYDLACRSLGLFAPYRSSADEIVRAFNRPGFLNGQWMGYAGIRSTREAKAWSYTNKFYSMLLRGKNTIMWWRWNDVGGHEGFLGANLDPYPASRDMLDATQVVFDGLGDLLAQSPMADSGVAILYSHPSFAANTVGAAPSFGGYEGTHVAWHRIIRRCGLQFRYITPGMIRRGEVDWRQLRILVLSRAECIGRDVAEKIEAFARNGGAVIADVRPGLYDEHLKRYATPVLDSLFGIARQGDPSAAAVVGRVRGEVGGKLHTVDLGEVKCDPGIRKTTGVPLGSAGGTPLLVTNKVGRGRAVLWNFVPQVHPWSRGNRPLADLLHDHLRDLGGRPLAEVRRGADRAWDVETVSWQNGNGRIMAFSLGPVTRMERWNWPLGAAQPTTVTVDPGADAHVYDLSKSPCHVGKLRAFDVRIDPPKPTFVFISPKELPEVAVHVDTDSPQQGQCVTAHMTVPAGSCRRTVHVTLVDPGGRTVRWLKRNVTLEAASDLLVPFAYNDPPGRWALEVKDVLTGTSSSHAITVRRFEFRGEKP